MIEINICIIRFSVIAYRYLGNKKEKKMLKIFYLRSQKMTFTYFRQV